MRLRLCLYGGLQRVGGGREHALELPGETMSVAELRAAIARAHPPLAPHLPTAALAIGDTIVTDDGQVRDGDEIGLLPPVSGG